MSALADKTAGVGDPVRLGVDEPWRFAANALNDELRSRGASLDEDRFEDCVSYLLVDLCKLAARYDPDRGSLSFTTFAHRILRRRYTSWLRKSRGDSRYGMAGREVLFEDAEQVFAIAGEYEPDLLEIVERYDHEGLSPNARATLRQLAVRVASGMNVTEAATDLCLSRREAAADLKRLRAELEL